MNKEQLFEELYKKKELIPDDHDGSYELMCACVDAYRSDGRFSSYTYWDLNAIYAMALGTWKLNIEKKKEYIEKGSLSAEEQKAVCSILDKVWDNACHKKYENRESDVKPTVGMFGTGFYSFSDVIDDDAQAFIKMLTEIAPLEEDNEIFSIVATVLDKPIKGLQAASASVILHCLKPFVFPILNGNSGNGTVYSALGINLIRPKDSTTYISNCRRIKAFRDEHFSFKNYRILDMMAWENSDDETPEEGQDMEKAIFDNNTILYGPPGTGKTYNTVNYAVAIIEGKSLEEVKHEDYDVVKERYEQYKDAGQIAFTTFHQSYGYEEFIEGIKPNINDENEDGLEYTIEPGIFKSFCEKAQAALSMDDIEYGLNKSPVVWKVSLESTGDNPTRRECLESNHIRIGWDSYGKDIVDDQDFDNGGKRELNAFINKMRVGDIVLSCYSAWTVDAIGVVTGEYEWHEEYDRYKRVRSVRWLVKGIDEDIMEITGGTSMTLSSVYQMKVSVADVLKVVEKYTTNGISKNNQKNFVFIIDEINRGNISKIFGELITLIENTKRIGAKEEMTLLLPYSGNKPFGVPKNVYILGTMNTADRSIALMDTALRRRFSFEEMMPKSDVLVSIGADKVVDGDTELNVAKMLDTINRRIEYLYDREHTIGHAFFTGLKDNPTIENLAGIFEKSVIPLLQEYFYEDYSKIQLVLGDNAKVGDNKQYQFIRDEEMVVNDVFAGVPDIEPETRYSIQTAAFTKIESYKLIGKGL